MQLLNEALLERKVDAQYATLSLVLWNSRLRIFTIASAGTLPPLVCRNGKILETHAEGVPIGLLDDQEYDQFDFVAQPDDLLLLYSDGVEDQLRDEPAITHATERAPVSGGSQSEEMVEYGRERLEKILSSKCKETPQTVVKAIFDDLDKFRGATPLTDDQSVIALRVL